MNAYIIIAASILSFGMIHLFVSLGIFFRISGLFSGNVYTSHSLERFFLLISSLWIALFTPMLAFLTEVLFSTRNFIYLAILSQLFTFLLLLVLLVFRSSIFSWACVACEFSKNNRHFYLKIIPSFFYPRASLFEFNRFVIIKLNLRFLIIGLLINIFAGSGFFIAFFLASSFPDYRLTFSQSAIFIHGFAVILQSLYADPALARIAENTDSNDWQDPFVSYLFGRCIAFLFMSFIFFFVYKFN